MTREIFHDAAQLLIALVLIICAFIFLYRLYFGGVAVDPALRESLMQVVGGVIGIIGTLVGYYFGTSLSSARKDTAQARITELAMFRRPTTTSPMPPVTPPPPEGEVAKAA